MTAGELMYASLKRRAVVGFLPNGKPLPAAFIIGMPFRLVALKLRGLKLYEKETKQ